ncbi:MAG TPA: TIR domain-containing protein [Casimicrobiaceae bacterium]
MGAAATPASLGRGHDPDGLLLSNPPKAVFLSYASQDVDTARRLCDALQAVGVEVWFDQSTLRGGDAWDASIRRQIKDCALFVPVISANTHSRSEGYFRLEWKLAVDRSHFMADDQPFLLPVAIDATLDADARVPAKFRDVQWTHLPRGASTSAFAEHVRRLLASGAASASPTATAPTAQLRAPSPHPAGTFTVPATGSAAPVSAVDQEPPSIAVLPFANRSRDEADEYFSDGLADELLNVLAKIRGLRVAARTSSFQFKGKHDDIAVIGRKLNVTTVLEGSVRKSGNRMRISVQLVKVADGYHLWSETYDRILEDIFAVQDDIAQSVVTELRTTLLGEAADAGAASKATAQVAAAVKGRASDPEAYRLYLQARYFIDRYRREDTTKGIGYLKQALVLDPAFALAWAELGAAYSSEAGKGWAPVTEGFARAREAVQRALALEPDLPEAHAQLGWIQIYHDRDWRGAEASYRRALELAPGNASVLRRSGALGLNAGRFDEAIALGRQSLQHDPLNTTAHHNLGINFYASGRLADAEAAFRKALELDPHRASTRAHLSLALLDQGRGEEALAEALQEPEEWCRLWVASIVHDAAGRREASDAALQALIANHSIHAAVQVALVYAARGEIDLAFTWLERANDQRDPGLSEMRSLPAFRSLRVDPRWEAFLRKIGFSD